MLRWRRADGGIVPLHDFLPTAEETGLIVPIGAMVLDKVAKTIGRMVYNRARPFAQRECQPLGEAV